MFQMKSSLIEHLGAPQEFAVEVLDDYLVGAAIDTLHQFLSGSWIVWVGRSGEYVVVVLERDLGYGIHLGERPSAQQLGHL